MAKVTTDVKKGIVIISSPGPKGDRDLSPYDHTIHISGSEYSGSTELVSLTVTGSILPEGKGNFDLGSEDHPFRDLYITTESLKFVNRSTGKVVSSLSAKNVKDLKEGKSIATTGKLTTTHISGALIVTGSTLFGKRIDSGAAKQIDWFKSSSLGKSGSGTTFYFDNYHHAFLDIDSTAWDAFVDQGEETADPFGDTNDMFYSGNWIWRNYFNPNSIPTDVVISSSGHMGIGTIKPKHTLHISGNSYQWKALYVEGDISASGNIHALNLTASGDIDLSGNVNLGNSCTDWIMVDGAVTASCDISSSATLFAKKAIIDGFITASGRISSSNTVECLGLMADIVRFNGIDDNYNNVQAGGIKMQRSASGYEQSTYGGIHIFQKDGGSAGGDTVFRNSGSLEIAVGINAPQTEIFQIIDGLIPGIIGDTHFVLSSDNDGLGGSISKIRHITSSGDISASGDMTFGTNCSNIHTIHGEITASCNISASGNVHALNITASGIQGTDVDLTGNVTLGTACTDWININGAVTASCDISSSKIIYAHSMSIGGAQMPTTNAASFQGNGIGADLNVIGNVSSSGTCSFSFINLKEQGPAFFSDWSVISFGSASYNPTNGQTRRSHWFSQNPSIKFQKNYLALSAGFNSSQCIAIAGSTHTFTRGKITMGGVYNVGGNPSNTTMGMDIFMKSEQNNRCFNLSASGNTIGINSVGYNNATLHIWKKWKGTDISSDDAFNSNITSSDGFYGLIASGSVALADSCDDIIELNGKTTASCDFSSSADIYAHTGSFNYVVSTGDISSSGNVHCLNMTASGYINVVGVDIVGGDKQILFSKGDNPDDTTVEITGSSYLLWDSGSKSLEITGSITASSIISTGPIYAPTFIETGTGTPTISSDSNLNLSASNAVVITDSPLRLKSYVNAETGSGGTTFVAGDIYFNSTMNKFYGYNGTNHVILG